MNNFDTIKFQDGDFEMDVNVSLEDNNIWLTIDEMANIFSKGRSAITKQINSLFRKDELEKGGMCAKMEHMVPSLNRTYTKTYYNLDVVNSISIKLKSNRGKLLQECLNNYLNSNLEFDNSNQIIIYNNGSLSLPVTISPEEETVWLAVKDIAKLFDTTTNNIYMHVKNIIEEGEISLDSVCKDSLLTQRTLKQIDSVGADGKTYLIVHYNLDMILAIGYRVKSKTAIEFRKWVTSVLKSYMLKGYSIDTNRLIAALENDFHFKEELKKVIERIDKLEKSVFPKPIKDKTFVDALPFDVHVVLADLFSTAKKSVIIIDPFCDITPLKYLKNLPKQIEKTIIQSRKGYLTEEDINSFKLSYGELSIFRSNDFHNRYLIIDNNQFYDLGASFNRMDKIFSITKLENEEDIQKLKSQIEEIINHECLE